MGRVEDLVERLARGKLIAVGYGKLRPAFLGAGPASKAHRASGDTIRWWHAAGRFPPVLGEDNR